MSDKEASAGIKEIARVELPSCHLGGEQHWEMARFHASMGSMLPPGEGQRREGESKGEEWADV